MTCLVTETTFASFIFLNIDIRMDYYYLTPENEISNFFLDEKCVAGPELVCCVGELGEAQVTAS